MEIRFTSGVLRSQLTRNERRLRLVLFDVQVERLSPEGRRFNLDLSLSPISLLDSSTGTVEGYIGFLGVEIEFEADGGRVVDHSPARALPVQFDLPLGGERSVTVGLNPKVKAKSQDIELSAELGGVEAKAALGGPRARLVLEEHPLAVDVQHDAVRWMFDLATRGLIRGFPYGNLSLFVDSVWESRAEGWITVTPSGIGIYDARKSRLPIMNAVRMKYQLWSRGMDISSLGQAKVRFWEGRQDGSS